MIIGWKINHARCQTREIVGFFWCCCSGRQMVFLTFSEHLKRAFNSIKIEFRGRFIYNLLKKRKLPAFQPPLLPPLHICLLTTLRFYELNLAPLRTFGWSILSKRECRILAFFLRLGKYQDGIENDKGDSNHDIRGIILLDFIKLVSWPFTGRVAPPALNEFFFIFLYFCSFVFVYLWVFAFAIFQFLRILRLLDPVTIC